MTKLNIGLESAYDTIVNDYDLQTLNEIVNHGCQSGVCSQHIYYADTIKFYEKHEADILAYFDVHYGTEFLVNLFEKAEACLNLYKNDVTWCYIEMIAFELTESLLQPA